MTEPTAAGHSGATAAAHTGADYLAAAAFDDRPPALIADVPLPVLEPDIQVILVNGHLPDLSGRIVWLWPAQTDASRERMATLASDLLSRPSAEVCLLIDAPPPTTLAEALAGLSAATAIPFHAPPAKRTRANQKPAKAPTADEASAYTLWEQLGLARNERGPYATEANALRILSASNHYRGRIWLDEFSQRLMINDPAATVTDRMFTRTDAIEAQVWMQDALKLPKMPLQAVERAAILVGARNARHPVREYLESIHYDNISRIDTLFSDAWGAPQDEYHAAAARILMLSMIARVYEPGCKVDTCVVFEGPQGITKSSALAILGGPWFLENTIDPVRKRADFLQALQGKLLVEIPEIDRVGGSRGNLMDLEALLSIRTDTFRAPYAPTTMDFPRQTVITGTTNFQEWNPNPTGARRFLPITCGEINLEYLTLNRNQLFAEALARYRRGEDWWSVPRETTLAAQAERRIVDPWEAIIEQYTTETPHRDHDNGVPVIHWVPRLEPIDVLQVGDLMNNCLFIPAERQSQAVQNRISRCLIAMGYRRTRLRLPGQRDVARAYTRGPA